VDGDPATSAGGEAGALEDVIGTNYVVIGTELYQRSASNGVLMKCILRSEGLLKLLQEIHGGECGNHAASANLVGKVYRSGFYWPTALADAQDLVR
jgi:hypothetical protein